MATTHTERPQQILVEISVHDGGDPRRQVGENKNGETLSLGTCIGNDEGVNTDMV